MTVALIDAGPLVALFDKKSPAHEYYLALLADSTVAWQLCTTWPCVVEASHFLSPSVRWLLLEWIGEGAVSLFPFEASHLQDMLPLMRKYTEPPRSDMDFADATLVWAANEIGVNAIMTIDVRDFSRYRLADGRAFEIL
jgi:predicted nucleic acid-binding protein